jgi:hypothetical protein
MNAEMNKRLYKVGQRVELIEMDDIQAPAPHTMGRIMFVDDIGQIHVLWDNGSTLALNTDYDEFIILH